MKDRVPRYPGRVTLTPVEGQANTYDMARADEPTEAGTPLNVETLLDGNVSNKIFSDTSESHTPSEAFEKLFDFASSGVLVKEVIESSQTWVAPENIAGTAFVLCVGGGGGGGGPTNNGSTDGGYYQNSGAGGGGGGSGYVSLAKVDIAPGRSYEVIIGAAGKSGSMGSVTSRSGTNGENGGSTSFGGVVIANGGEGGKGATATTGGHYEGKGGDGGNGNAGGGGGGTSSSNSTYPSGSGGNGYYGGGGAAGASNSARGNGGNSVYGGGGGGKVHGTSGPNIGPLTRRPVYLFDADFLDTTNWQGNKGEPGGTRTSSSYASHIGDEGIGGAGGAIILSSSYNFLSSYTSSASGGGFFANGRISNNGDSYPVGGPGGGGMFSSYKSISYSGTVGSSYCYGAGAPGGSPTFGPSGGGGGGGFGVRNEYGSTNESATTWNPMYSQYNGVCVIYYHLRSMSSEIIPAREG